MMKNHRKIYLTSYSQANRIELKYLTDHICMAFSDKLATQDKLMKIHTCVIISYTYTKTIANKIFNFSSTLSDLNYHQFHNNPSQCGCNTSSHLYQPYGHVITGDLSIIPNFKLRDLIAKSLKYREPCKVDWDKNLSLLCEAVDQYALQWAKREIVELSVLLSWREMVKEQTEERISEVKLNFKHPTGKVLQNADVKVCLSEPHSKYVFVPAAKTPNNVIIICKQYYIETFMSNVI